MAGQKLIVSEPSPLFKLCPLGFSIIGSTVTLDLFLRWATQGPLGPLVYIKLFAVFLSFWKMYSTTFSTLHTSIFYKGPAHWTDTMNCCLSSLTHVWHQSVTCRVKLLVLETPGKSRLIAMVSPNQCLNLIKLDQTNPKHYFTNFFISQYCDIDLFHCLFHTLKKQSLLNQRHCNIYTDDVKCTCNAWQSKYNI